MQTFVKKGLNLCLPTLSFLASISFAQLAWFALLHPRARCPRNYPSEHSISFSHETPPPFTFPSAAWLPISNGCSAFAALYS